MGLSFWNSFAQVDIVGQSCTSAELRLFVGLSGRWSSLWCFPSLEWCFWEQLRVLVQDMPHCFCVSRSLIFPVSLWYLNGGYSVRSDLVRAVYPILPGVFRGTLLWLQKSPPFPVTRTPKFQKLTHICPTFR